MLYAFSELRDRLWLIQTTFFLNFYRNRRDKVRYGRILSGFRWPVARMDLLERFFFDAGSQHVSG
jgi:hypothetical protein